MQIKDKFDPEIRKIIKKTPIAVIPVGSLEQHGPHLPISTDTDIVTAISKRLAESCKFFLMPTLPFGVSYEHAPLFHTSIKNTTLRNTLQDIISSLADNKIKIVFIINGHHGNQKAIKGISKIIKKRIKIVELSYWHFMSRDFDHAGFVETSLMLAISENTKMSKAIKGFTPKDLTPKDKIKMDRLAARSFLAVAKNGIWGDPRGATKKAGIEIFDEIVSNLKKECKMHLNS